MNVSIPLWFIPLMITVIAYWWAFMEESHGPGVGVLMLARLVVATFVTMLSWIIFLSVKLYLT